MISYGEKPHVFTDRVNFPHSLKISIEPTVARQFFAHVMLRHD